MAGYEQDVLNFLHACRQDFKNLLAHETQIHSASRMMHEEGKRLPSDPILAEIQTNLDQTIPHIKDLTVMARLMLIATAIKSMIHGRESALAYVVAQMCNGDLQQTQPRISYIILNAFGWFDDIDAQTLIRVTEYHSPKQNDVDAIAAEKSLRILRMLGIGESSNLSWLEKLVDTLAVPWMLQALERDFTDCALIIEEILYSGWLRRVELLQHYNDSYARWASQMHAAGLRLREKLGPLKPAHMARPKIGVFIHAGNWLAHTALLHRSFSGLKDRNYDIRLYIPHKIMPEFVKNFADINVDCVCLEDHMDKNFAWSITTQMKTLRELTQKDGTQVMIWLCLGTGMSFAYGLGLAPHQIHWSMRSMVSTLKGMDDRWMAFNEPKNIINFQGNPWKATPVTMTPNAKPEPAAIAAIKQKYPGKVILGTLVREDKLNANIHFLNTVCDILERHPNTVYLHTGRTELPEIKSVFETRNVGERVHFVGWVDPNLYAHVFDIYLDCWPARSGVTLFNALEAKTPMIFYMGDHSDHYLSRLSFLFFELHQRGETYHLEDEALDKSFDLPDGSRGILAFEDIQKYHACIDRLINDPEYRKLCGAAGRTLYAYLTDEEQASRKVAALMEEALKTAKEKINASA